MSHNLQMYTNAQSNWYIGTGVVAVHLLIGLGMLFTATAPLPPYKAREKLVVKTVKLEPSKAQFHATSQTESVSLIEPIQEELIAVEDAAKEPVVEKKAEPVENVQEVLKPVIAIEKKQVTVKPVEKAVAKAPEKPKPKPILKPNPKPAPKPVPKPTSKPVETVQNPTSNPIKKIDSTEANRQALLQKVQGSLAKIDTKSHKGAPSHSSSFENSKLPTALGSLNSENMHKESLEGQFTVRERNYRDELSMRLKLNVKLPDRGIVDLKLTLGRAGNVIKIEITSAESAKNRAHLQKLIPTLNFPPFGDNFGKEVVKTFPLTFSSN